MSSSGSGAPPPRARCPAPGWASRSWPARCSRPGATCRSRRRRAAAPWPLCASRAHRRRRPTTGGPEAAAGLRAARAMGRGGFRAARAPGRGGAARPHHRAGPAAYPRLMTDAAAPESGRQVEALDALTPEQVEEVLGLLAEAATSDGTQAVSEQGRLQLRGAGRAQKLPEGSSIEGGGGRRAQSGLPEGSSIEGGGGRRAQSGLPEGSSIEGGGGRREGVRHFLVYSSGELVGYGQLEDTDPVEAPAAEFVVRPGHR